MIVNGISRVSLTSNKFCNKTYKININKANSTHFPKSITHQPFNKARTPVHCFFGFFNKIGNQLSFMAKSGEGCELAPASPPTGLEYATFAGGCFWGLELAMQRVPGVKSTFVGYTHGEVKNPTYESVCSGMTGHTEAVLMTYDPNEVKYKTLLDEYYLQTDPTTLNRQGNDRGTQYRSGLYYHSNEQKSEIEESIKKVQKELDEGKFRRVIGNKVVVEVKPAIDFYIAEDYHQQYLAKGGRFNSPQSAEKGCRDKIRCYG